VLILYLNFKVFHTTQITFYNSNQCFDNKRKS